MGSFAGAQIWRLRAGQLAEDTAAGVPVDTAEMKRLKKITGHSYRDDRSRCLHCGHTLAWYDLIPIVSWLSTRGNCRYCKTPIGRFEPMIELATAATFLTVTHIWISAVGVSALSLLILALWLAAATMLIILFVYDLKWFLLPDKVMFPLIGLSLVINLLQTWALPSPDVVAGLVSSVVSVGILSGIYLILWFVSKGNWVGFGDVKLGIALGLLIADWKLALLTLFLANLLGTLVVIPGLVSGKLSRRTQVPFGPFLIAGFFISLLAGGYLIAGYQDFTVWLTSVLLML